MSCSWMTAAAKQVLLQQRQWQGIRVAVDGWIEGRNQRDCGSGHGFTNDAIASQVQPVVGQATVIGTPLVGLSVPGDLDSLSQLAFLLHRMMMVLVMMMSFVTIIRMIMIISR